MPKIKIKKLSPFVTVFALVAIYFVYYFNFQSDAATSITPTAKTAVPAQKQPAPAVSVPKYVPGEVIVKLKQPISEFSSKSFTSPNYKSTAINYSNINKAKSPAVISEIDKKYHIKAIEKTFPLTASADVEIQKIKKRLATTASAAGTTQAPLDEAKVRANDLSRIYTIEIDPNLSAIDVAKDLSKNPNIEYAEPNYEVLTTLEPNDEYFHESASTLNQWYLENTGLYPGSLKSADIHAVAAWNITRGSPSVIIAVLDTGIDYTHPDLGGGFGPTYKVMGGYDLVNNDTNPMDDSGHGTHIAGIIAANINNRQGVAGVCPGCKLMAVKVMGPTGSGNVVRAANGIQYAVDHGAKVISMSFGTSSNSPTMQAALQIAVLNGVIPVGAAGNNRSSTKFYPAAFPEVIGVANTNLGDSKAESSNFDDGTHWVNIAAPGSNILSTALPAGPVGICRSTTSTRYTSCTGTSMAAPVVAGVVGLYVSLHPVTDLASEKAAVAHIIAASSVDNIDARNPLYVQKLGAGRINAYKVLTAKLAVGQTWCSDSDWGADHTVAGYVQGNGAGCSTHGVTYDACATDTHYVNEKTCGSGNACVSTAYKCPYGCMNGHCILRDVYIPKIVNPEYVRPPDKRGI